LFDLPAQQLFDSQSDKIVQRGVQFRYEYWLGDAYNKGVAFYNEQANGDIGLLILIVKNNKININDQIINTILKNSRRS